MKRKKKDATRRLGFLFRHFFLSMVGADGGVDMVPMDKETITWRSETSRVRQRKTKGTGNTAALNAVKGSEEAPVLVQDN
jgi:hypothetical protein